MMQKTSKQTEQIYVFTTMEAEGGQGYALTELGAFMRLFMYFFIKSSIGTHGEVG